MQPNPAFLPTGEVRVPKQDEPFRWNRWVVTSTGPIECEREIYRAVPASQVVELTPRVRCKLAFAEMWRVLNNRDNSEAIESEYARLCVQMELAKFSHDLADAMEALTLSMKESEGDT